MHEGAVPWREGQCGCLVCCASGRRVGAAPGHTGAAVSAECSVVLGALLAHEQTQGHQGPCMPRVTFLEMTDVDGDPRVGSGPQRWRHKMGNGRVWDGAGLEMVAVLPMGSKPGNPASALGWASSTLDSPYATTGTGADEVTSLAQRLGQCREQGLDRDRATWPSWEARGELGAARVALARQWGDQTPCEWKGGIPKLPCMVSISPAALSHVQKHCVRSIHALECPMAAGRPLSLAAARMAPAHHVTLGPLRSSQDDSTSGSWQGAGDRR